MNNNKIFLNCLYVAAFVSFIFILTISILLIFQRGQLNAAFPPDFKELEQMKETAKTGYASLELQKMIRLLDLMSRRGWFLGQEWQKSAIRLLIGGAVFFIFCMSIIAAIRPVKIDMEMLKPEKRSPGFDSLALMVTASVCVITVNGVLYFSAVGAPGKEMTEPIVETKTIASEEFKKNWPSFRGSNNDGIAIEHKTIFGWSTNSKKGILWKTEIPLPGNSSPIVWENRLFITGGDKSKRALFCYDADAGKLLWTHEATGIIGSPAIAPEVGKETGYAASTPATDGNRVFAIFATGDLLATDFTGKRIWAKNLDAPKNMYGYSSSLLVVRDRLIVQYDNNEKQILYCFDTATGAIVWQQQRQTMVSWSSPTFFSFAKKELILTLTCGEVAAFELASGKKEWTQKIMGGEVVPSATCHENLIFVANENAVSAAIDGLTGKLLWKNDKVVLPDVCSPVVFENMLFLFSSASSISCLDTATGKLLWEKNVSQGFYSSPILLKDRIIAFDMKGNSLIIKPDRSDLIIEHQDSLGESVLTTPAIVENKMWVRGSASLFNLEGAIEKNVGK
ncbi:MAG: PQQ-binding-like beta-propeller repeat protein [Candidatus Riflebacteria bacterium]|nr:PQQ-binding-like beta-propeller repeat protein [Candidatus Riflebacteria bacterium]